MHNKNRTARYMIEAIKRGFSLETRNAHGRSWWLVPSPMVPEVGDMMVALDA